MFRGKGSNVAVQSICESFVDRQVVHFWQKAGCDGMFMVCNAFVVGDTLGAKEVMHLWQVIHL